MNDKREIFRLRLFRLHYSGEECKFFSWQGGVVESSTPRTKSRETTTWTRQNKIFFSWFEQNNCPKLNNFPRTGRRQDTSRLSVVLAFLKCLLQNVQSNVHDMVDQIEINIYNNEGALRHGRALLSYNTRRFRAFYTGCSKKKARIQWFNAQLKCY